MSATALQSLSPRDGVREIPLTQSRVAIIDAADFEWLTQWNWHLAQRYAARTIKRAGKCSKIWLHRVITAAPDGVLVDHINGETLDNRRSNLRLCTGPENARNRGKNRGAKSAYKGVYRDKWGAFRATIFVDGATRHLGSFATEVQAAHAYDCAALKHHRDFARLNFSQERDWLFIGARGFASGAQAPADRDEDRAAEVGAGGGGR